MANRKFYDNTADVSQANPGTGDFILQGTAPPAGLAAFRIAKNKWANNDSIEYLAVDNADTTKWEIGYGTFTTSANHLTRNVTNSSNSDAAVNFTGTCNIYGIVSIDSLAAAVLTTAGDLLYHDGTTLVRLAIGSNGAVLNLASGIPAWNNNVSLPNGGARTIQVTDATSGNSGNAFTVRAGNGTGTNQAGGALVFKAGLPTGNGTPGSITLQGGYADSSGSSQSSASTYGKFQASGTIAVSSVVTFQIGSSGNSRGDLVFNSLGASQHTITPSSLAQNVTYTLPDVGTNANFVMDQGTQTLAGATTFSSALTVTGGNLIIGTAGKGLQIKGGSNAKIGTAVLSGGTVTVSTTAVTSNSLIFLTDQTGGLNLGNLSVGTITAGTSFVINSSNVADSSTVAWLIVEKG